MPKLTSTTRSIDNNQLWSKYVRFSRVEAPLCLLATPLCLQLLTPNALHWRGKRLHAFPPIRLRYSTGRLRSNPMTLVKRLQLPQRLRVVPLCPQIVTFWRHMPQSIQTISWRTPCPLIQMVLSTTKIRTRVNRCLRHMMAQRDYNGAYERYAQSTKRCSRSHSQLSLDILLQ